MNTDLFEDLRPNYSSACFPAPRPFQLTAHEALRQGLRDGHRCQMLMSPTGMGTTEVAMTQHADRNTYLEPQCPARGIACLRPLQPVTPAATTYKTASSSANRCEFAPAPIPPARRPRRRKPGAAVGPESHQAGWSSAGRSLSFQIRRRFIALAVVRWRLDKFPAGDPRVGLAVLADSSDTWSTVATVVLTS